MWTAVVIASLGAYLEKLAGFLLPARFLNSRAVRHTAELLPVALLAAIVAVQALTSGRAIMLDARVPGMAVAFILIWKRANFLVMVVLSMLTTAAVRYFGLLA